MSERSTGLLGILPQSEAEEALLAAVASSGEGALLDAGGTVGDGDHAVRGEFLAAFCAEASIGRRFARHGMTIRGATVVGRVDLVAVRLEWPLRFIGCRFDAGLDLRRASIPGLSFHDSRVASAGLPEPALSASGLCVEGALELRGVRIEGALDLSEAWVRGQLALAQTSCGLTGGDAFLAPRLRVDGDLEMDGLICTGRWALTDAKIGGRASFRGCVADNPSGEALQVDRIATGGPVAFDLLTARGGVSLYGAKIGGDLALRGGRLDGTYDFALFATGVEVDGDVDLGEDIEVAGRTTFFGSTLRGGFRANAALLVHRDGVCLDLSEARVSWNVLLDAEAIPNSEDGAAPSGPSSTVGTVGRAGLTLRGQVRLRRTVVNGDTRIAGDFAAEQWPALDLSGLRVGGDLLLRRSTTVRGGIEASRASIGGGLVIAGRLLAGDAPHLFVGRDARIEGVFRWLPEEVSAESSIDLARMRAGALEDRFDAWPRRLRLDGFVYQEIVDSGQEVTLDQRIEWLSHQEAASPAPQPYEQLAEILRRRGERSRATTVLVAKQRVLGRLAGIGVRQRLWDALKHATVRYGYAPERAGWVLLAAWLVGGAAYWSLARLDGFQPTLATDIGSLIAIEGIATPHYPRFQPLVFSAEMTVPLLELFQKTYWEPDQSSPWGGVAWVLLWLHRLIGWTFTLIFGAAQLDLLRND